MVEPSLSTSKKTFWLFGIIGTSEYTYVIDDSSDAAQQCYCNNVTAQNPWQLSKDKPKCSIGLNC